MSYKIGQFRRDMLGSRKFLNNISYTIVPINVILQNSANTTTFTDYVLNLSDDSLSYGNSYYLKIGVKRDENTTQIITINLRQNKEGESTSIEDDKNIQVLDTITIPADDGSVNKTAIIELAFSPNATYNQIMLTLQRTASDYTIENDLGTIGRLIEIDETTTLVASFFNILNILTDGDNAIQSLKKIGVQGPPGLLMCINGQNIRIGPSGIYEIKNDYKITSIGFAIDKSDTTLDKRNYFILDYQY